MPNNRPERQSARVFFALWPLGEAGQAIADHAARAAIDGKRVSAARLHLTLAFYGKCEPDAIATLIRRADAVDGQAFKLVIDRLGCFRRSRVVWVAPQTLPSALLSLAAALAPAAGQGIDRPPFRPHITVSRRGRCPTSSTFPAIPLTATSFALVASGEGGAPGAYRALARWPLR